MVVALELRALHVESLVVCFLHVFVVVIQCNNKENEAVELSHVVSFSIEVLDLQGIGPPGFGISADVQNRETLFVVCC